jgi:hypothetical protein
MSDIEARVKALEDWQQALARVFLAPPQPSLKQQTENIPAHVRTNQDDPLVCACGQPKKAGFKQCYACWEKKAGN